MKICKTCNQTEETVKFRPHRATCCKGCESKKTLEGYYKNKIEDKDFLKKHAVRERTRRRTVNGCKHGLYSRAKSRAKEKNWEFSIELDDVHVPTHCPIFGIPLQVSEQMSDGSPSLDRIDPKRGYVKGNVQVISTKANTIKNNATVEELKLVYEYMKKLEQFS